MPPVQFVAVEVAEKVTSRGARPEVGVADAVQVSTHAAETVTVPVWMQVRPSAETVTDQLKVPGLL